MFFQSSDYFQARLIAEQHAAFEALQGLGLLESATFFMESDYNIPVSTSPPFHACGRSEVTLSSIDSIETPCSSWLK